MRRCRTEIFFDRKDFARKFPEHAASARALIRQRSDCAALRFLNAVATEAPNVRGLWSVVIELAGPDGKLVIEAANGGMARVR